MGIEDDPDPTEFLYVSLETKRKDQTKPYDGKKMVWVPDAKDGFLLGDIKSTKGDMVTVDVPGGEVSEFLLFILVIYAFMAILVNYISGPKLVTSIL